MEDQQIIRLFFERSEQAIAELAKAHGSAAARVARNILGSERDAEECLNDTYLAVWNAIPPQKPDPLRTFVCKIARNLAAAKYHANTAKKRNSRYDAALDEHAGHAAGDGCAHAAAFADERRVVDEMLHGWMLLCREVVSIIAQTQASVAECVSLFVDLQCAIT